MSEVISCDIGLDSLPVELMYTIIDHFSPSDYSYDYQNALNVIRLSQVNHSFHALSQDPEFYRRLWRKYLSNNPPDNPTELQREYLKALHELEQRESVHQRIRLAIRNDWIHVFNLIFDPADYTLEKEQEYFREQKETERTDDQNQSTEEELPYDDDGETRINQLLNLAIYYGRLSMIDLLLDGGAELNRDGDEGD